jgi:hypothetical protein
MDVPDFLLARVIGLVFRVPQEPFGDSDLAPVSKSKIDLLPLMEVYHSGMVSLHCPKVSLLFVLDTVDSPPSFEWLLDGFGSID